MQIDIDQLKAAMEAYLKKFKKMQPTVHQLGDGLQLRTQAANQTSEEGRSKFKYQRETVWLSIKHPNRLPINLAKLSEGEDELAFEILALVPHEEVLTKHFNKILEVAGL